MDHVSQGGWRAVAALPLHFDGPAEFSRTGPIAHRERVRAVETRTPIALLDAYLSRAGSYLPSEIRSAQACALPRDRRTMSYQPLVYSMIGASHTVSNSQQQPNTQATVAEVRVPASFGAAFLMAIITGVLSFQAPSAAVIDDKFVKTMIFGSILANICYFYYYEAYTEGHETEQRKVQKTSKWEWYIRVGSQCVLAGLAPLLIESFYILRLVFSCFMCYCLFGIVLFMLLINPRSI